MPRTTTLLCLGICLAHAVVSSEKKTGKQRSVYLIGPTGVGKSALGSELAGSDDDDSGFEVSGDMESKTTWVSSLSKVFTYTSQTLENMVQQEDVFLTVSDSPGLSDSKGRSTQFLDDIITSMRAANPHGIVIVIRAGRDSHELQLSMRALSECLGVLLEDQRRIALFVNMLPTDFQLRMETPPIKKLEAQIAKRQEIVSHSKARTTELLRLKPIFGIKVAIGNTHGAWDGVDALKRFIAEMPDSPIELGNVRSWTEVMSSAKEAVSRSQVDTKQIKLRRQELEQRVSTIKANIKYYEESMGGGLATAGVLATGFAAGAFGLSMFIPGVNVATTLALLGGGGGAVAGVYGGANVYQSSGLGESLKEAEAELAKFMNQNLEQKRESELQRSVNLLKDVEELEKRIDTVEQSNL